MIPSAFAGIDPEQVFVIGGCERGLANLVGVTPVDASCEASFAGAGSVVFLDFCCGADFFGIYLIFAIKMGRRCPTDISRQRRGKGLRRATPAFTRREHYAHVGLPSGAAALASAVSMTLNTRIHHNMN
jgi:hypothetical protein